MAKLEKISKDFQCSHRRRPLYSSGNRDEQQMVKPKDTCCCYLVLQPSRYPANHAVDSSYLVISNGSKLYDDQIASPLYTLSTCCISLLFVLILAQLFRGPSCAAALVSQSLPARCWQQQHQSLPTQVCIPLQLWKSRQCLSTVPTLLQHYYCLPGLMPCHGSPMLLRSHVLWLLLLLMMRGVLRGVPAQTARLQPPEGRGHAV
jgi:hypothetical protein